jgi:hypothetical protein
MNTAATYTRRVHRCADDCMAALENAAFFQSNGQADRAERARQTAQWAAENALAYAIKAAAKQVAA